MSISQTKISLLFTTVCLLGLSCNDVPTASHPASGPESIRTAEFKKGGGKGPPQDQMWPVEIKYLSEDATSYKIHGDGPNGSGWYRHEECGVSARINAGVTDDLITDPDTDWSSKFENDPGCDGPRTITIRYDDPADLDCTEPANADLCIVETFGTFLNVNELGCLLRNADGSCHGDPAVDTWVETTAQFNPPFCAHGLKFNPVHKTAEQPVNNVRARLVATDPKVWEVATLEPDSEDPEGRRDVAVCVPDEHGGKGKGKGKPGKPGKTRHYYHLPFRIFVRCLDDTCTQTTS